MADRTGLRVGRGIELLRRCLTPWSVLADRCSDDRHNSQGRPHFGSGRLCPCINFQTRQLLPDAVRTIISAEEEVGLDQKDNRHSGPSRTHTCANSRPATITTTSRTTEIPPHRVAASLSQYKPPPPSGLPGSHCEACRRLCCTHSHPRMTIGRSSSAPATDRFTGQSHNQLGGEEEQTQPAVSPSRSANSRSSRTLLCHSSGATRRSGTKASLHSQDEGWAPALTPSHGHPCHTSRT
ncbi:hypothetical protein GE09DRAFT_17189 [Coniochaeta sp. 2T2.1]|nr:hypothetical protein GE09DRAFT_17189 [Coniochaeta sp. 2T2.1]